MIVVLIAALFLFCSYFGTDQSQVQRYLTARSVDEARHSLLMSAYWKIPLQALVLLVGVLMFVFYVFTPSPLLFDPARARQMSEGPRAMEYAALERRHEEISASRAAAAAGMARAETAGDAQLLAARTALVGAVERRITDDARARVRTGELTGPFSRTTCGPILKSKAAIPDDRVLSKGIGRYDCVAVKRDVTLHPGQKVAELGYAFVAALNFKTYTYTWCRNNPAQGEAGKALVFVRLARACLAAKGKALGTGYVAAPGEQNETTDDR